MSKWRPGEWGNPYNILIINPIPENADSTAFTAFEAGADALLEALKGTGIKLVPKMMQYHLRGWIYPQMADGKISEFFVTPDGYPDLKGTLIFIPDDP